ncbi:hypothetical protein ppKF707_1872 [Metapseudomonas furukawaii]|uniref:Uncharacterized protein n=1 Tax=Metapseudomonas furukawaii TaxID=1149133 RepID=A0AAD1C5B1_METFU|nr:hypothetical protein ppKF707_1872 [Pseudomonas furukawaii]BAU76866.1 hypothetical protein KF707C_51780 [Pseudomonas furukawaii]
MDRHGEPPAGLDDTGSRARFVPAPEPRISARPSTMRGPPAHPDGPAARNWFAGRPGECCSSLAAEDEEDGNSWRVVQADWL